MAKYKYELTSRIGTREVSPQNTSSLQLTWAKDKNRSEYTQKLNGKFVLAGEDFNWLYLIEQTIYRCEPVALKIYKRCAGGYRTFFETEVSLNSGTWDLERCRVELQASDSDKYRCWEDNKGTEYNLFSFLSDRKTVTPIMGEIETNTVTDTIPNTDTFDQFPGEPDPYSKGWLQQEYHEVPIGDDIQYTVTWVREHWTGPGVPDASWTLVGSDYYRAPVLYNQVADVFDNSNPAAYGYSLTLFNSTIDNGLTLRDIMTFLVSNTCPGLTLQSEFFQWNSAAPTTVNYVTGLPSKVLDLIFFQKSDVKRAAATNNATIFKTTPERFIEDLCTMFQLEWEITNDGKFKIEHVSFKNNAAGIDATTSEFMTGKRVYSYDSENLPQKETFTFMENSFYGDFAPNSILYSGACVGQGGNKEQPYNVEKFTTDIVLVVSNPSSDSSRVEDDGFVPVATDGAGAILSEATIMGGNPINNTLSWAHLVRDYWRHNRPQRKLTMNGFANTAITVKPTKAEEAILVKYCCADEFVPDRLIKTHLGSSGILKSAKYSLYTEMLQLSILHPADEGLIENQAPVGIAASFDTPVDTPVTMDVLANVTDADGNLEPSTLEILLQPSQGTAVITVDYKITYTPAPGYVGNDFLSFRVKDSYSEPSIAQAVTINVLP